LDFLASAAYFSASAIEYERARLETKSLEMTRNFKNSPIEGMIIL
jgi:hypothetical protein